MKTIVLSDLHLTKKFDPRKYNYLVDTISSFDRVIIVGDLWDFWFVDFKDFIDSEWKIIFPLLKSKQTIYLFGNHDGSHHCDDRVSLFAAEAADSYQINSKLGEINFIHGDSLIELQAISPFFYYLLLPLAGDEKGLVINHLRRFATKIADLGYVVVPKYAVYNWVNKNLNNKMKQSSVVKGRNGWTVVGHSHRPEIDYDSKYLNTGLINAGFASYAVINDEEISLVTETY